MGAKFKLIGLPSEEVNMLSSELKLAWIVTGLMKYAAFTPKRLAMRRVASNNPILAFHASSFCTHTPTSPTIPSEIPNCGAGEDLMHAAFVAEKNSLKESSPQQPKLL